MALAAVLFVFLPTQANKVSWFYFLVSVRRKIAANSTNRNKKG
jgi:hypothetical protein